MKIQISFYQKTRSILFLCLTFILSVNISAQNVKDIDDNTYKTVKIGSQVWMAENLKVTHYRNGDPIPNVMDKTQWGTLTSGACCISYASFAGIKSTDDVKTMNTYGRLYNWFAVNDSRKIAPNGWHVPTDAEWQTLVDYLGGDNVAGNKMKEADTTHWYSPNEGATNETGFTALPGGICGSAGTCSFPGNIGAWWSATEGPGTGPWHRSLSRYNGAIGRIDYYNKNCGLSVRLLKD